jgi:hypothetical protein
LIRYDIKTYLLLPDREKVEEIKIIVDVEAQKDDNPGYEIPIRGLFYCCRLVSAQLSTEFTVDTEDSIKYDNLKKVYSIWICTNTAQKRANCIDKYSIQRKHLVGNNPDQPRYDLLTVIVINISAKHDYEDTESELIRMLTDLLNDQMDARTKIELLEKEHNLPLTVDTKKEVEGMCSYTEHVKNEGIAEGLAAEKSSIIKKMLTKGKTPEEIADLCDYDIELVRRVQEELMQLV